MTTKWVPLEERLIEGLTFDDVFVIPHRSEVHPREVDISTELCRGIKIATPFVSSPMDTVTEEKMVIAIELFGGYGYVKDYPVEKLMPTTSKPSRFMWTVAIELSRPPEMRPMQRIGSRELPGAVEIASFVMCHLWAGWWEPSRARQPALRRRRRS